MRITTKGRYALRAVIALAETSVAGKPVSIKAIAEREDISAEFLEQIFFRLRRSGLIRSARGPGGGFSFALPLDRITLMDLISASGEGLEVAPCLCGKGACGKMAGCRARSVWQGLDASLRAYAESRTVADMINGG